MLPSDTEMSNPADPAQGTLDVGGADLTVFLVVVPAVLLATMLAAYVPAGRASRIAPTEALRCE